MFLSPDAVIYEPSIFYYIGSWFVTPDQKWTNTDECEWCRSINRCKSIFLGLSYSFLKYTGDIHQMISGNNVTFLEDVMEKG